MKPIAIKIPVNSQLVIFPMKECAVVAGFKDLKYQTDPSHPFVHYGIDFDSKGATDFNVLASGNGIVLGTEFNVNNSLGGVVVVKYPKVYIPATKQVKDLVFRYMHMSKVNVTKGSSVSAYSVIGVVSGSHKWWNHIHLEIDADMAYPFHTPQVSESSSAMLITYGSNDSTLLDPINVLVVGKNQTAIVHPLAKCVSAKDKPKYKELDFISDTVEVPPAPSQASQRLILPVNNSTITAGYKNPQYRSKFGFGHFGLDMVGQSTIYASGNGTVIACGLDNVLGNVIVIKYKNVLNHKSGKSSDIIMRYNHLASIRVRSGQNANKDTVLGIMGNTGKFSTGTHLHIEVDTDARDQYACWTPTISGSSNIMKAGQDSTFNPAEILHIKTSAPDKQSAKRLFDGYSCDADINMPTIQ